MKITLLSTFDRIGGAAIAALRLYKGLRLLGQDAWMLVKEKNCVDPHILKMDTAGRKNKKQEKVFHRLEQQLFGENRTDLSNTRFSMPYPGYDLSKTAVVRNADIVNLHWVALFQSLESVAALLASGRPVVWTLHDQNPFSGGCHYSAGCLGYRSDCRQCPQLRENALELPARVLAAKKEFWRRNLTIVSPSRWLADCARKSSLFRKNRVEVIANSLEHEIYRPEDKRSAKKALGLNPDCLHLLFSSFTSNEKRKGYFLLYRALQYCLRQERFRALAAAGGVAVLAAGLYEAELKNLAIPLHSLGLVDDDKQLARIYAAADILVLPSEEENLPNVMLEAMACGTPVVSFAQGGMPDVIQSGVNGMLASAGSPEDLAEAVLSLIDDADLRIRQGLNARQVIEQKFKLSDQSRNYLRLFEELLAAQAPASASDKASMSVDEIRAPAGPIVNKMAVLLPYFKAAGRDLLRKKRFGRSSWIAAWSKKWHRLFLSVKYSGIKKTALKVIRKLFKWQ